MTDDDSAGVTAALGLADTEAGPDIADEEDFRPAAEVFKDPRAFDFLLAKGQGATAVNGVNLARESLYVKFDPLVGRPSVIGALAAAADSDGGQHVGGAGRLDAVTSLPDHPQTGDLIAMQSPSPKKTSAPTTSPPRPSDDGQAGPRASSSASPTAPDSGQRRRSSDGSDRRASDELEEEPEDDVRQQLARKEARAAALAAEKQAKMASVDRLKHEVRARKESEEQMKQVLKEYERTISELIGEKERERQTFEEERSSLASERDQAAEDLRNVEAAFADVHRKYERTKSVVEGFKQNEETLKRCVEEYQGRLRRQDQKYELLKAHAEETLEKANKEIEAVASRQDAEVARLTALLKKAEMKVREIECSILAVYNASVLQANGLEKAVEQKQKENEELTAICDELIAKVGSN